MSWHFSRALVAEYLVENSWDGEPSVPLSGNPTPQAFLSPDRMTAFSHLSRFGMTFKPLTESLGAAVLMWCLAASRVRTSHVLERGLESKESGLECGSTWRESSVKYCLASSGWKTHRCLWEEDLEWSSLTLPKWGMMRNGVLWERITPELRTNETESGLWRTPTAHEWKNTGYSTQIHLSDQVRPSQVKNPKKAAAMWRTPSANDPGVSAERLVPIEGGTPGGMNRHFDKHTGRMAQIGLIQQVRLREMWPTPQCDDAKNSGKNQTRRQTLASKVWAFPTPTATDAIKGGNVSARPGAMGLSETLGGQLNPPWVEWLMGWPLGWTDLKPSGMDKFQVWCDSHGKSYRKEATDEMP
jgi:hypothetical protein